ncbi:hypothetical protein CASFOL_005690 [Castilleja foliolosa]|uniref:Ninja-family protein n=1 Tax=Castilleja foliolosa TaxID=1961234 RepID=A0ABD3E4R1_9LAMI
MGEDGAMLEVSKMEEGKSDDFELSLELSIGGGKYEKPENSRGEKIMENSEGPKNNNFGRSDLSGDGPVDMQRRKEIQALRRQEARKKRGEKLKNLRKVGFLENVNNNNNNNKLLFDAQKCQARVEDRGIREKDGLLGEKIRKRGKNGGGGEVGKDELSLTLFTENKNVAVVVPSQQRENRECVLYPKVQYIAEPLNYGFGYPNNGGEETVSNRSLEQNSSAVSDYQSSSHKGGSFSDTGSLPRNEFDQHFESNDSSCQTEPDHHLRVDPTKLASSSSCDPHSSWGPFPDRRKLVPDTRFFDQPNNNSFPATPRPSAQTSGGGLNDDKRVEPVTGGPKNAALPVVHMPCVSTTGNGPNGRTIRGFLYKYTKTEVSIVCVCHGSSFSPAGFVEHAGGVDISHPLRHITIVGQAFG